MKLAKLLLLLIGVILVFSANAQNDTSASKPVVVKMPSLAEPLRSSANPRYMVLKQVTRVYHQPADTASGHYFKLGPGTRIYIRDWTPDGLLIDLGFGNGERYYLPNKSVKGLQTFVEI